MTETNVSKTVLITGATSGIGYELAKLFARDRYNLILVARTAIDLLSTTAELKAAGAAGVTCLDFDLSVAGTPDELFAEIRRREINVDILVNNAGAGEHGLFRETDLQKELGIIQLNVTSVVHLTKLFLKDMLDRNSGKVLQVSSVAAYQPSPRLAVYAATKSFILYFSYALINEIRDTKVTMTVLIPNATDTDFFNRAGMENTVAAQGELEDPSVVAKLGYEGLMKGDHHVLCPGVRQQIVMSKLLSHDAVAEIADKQMQEKF